MKIDIIGGGPGGLYFAILMKGLDAAHEVTVYERNRADDTFGFGVVFSDATMDNLRQADAASHAAITKAFFHWDDIVIHYRDQQLRSTGHGFAGLSRLTLLALLAARCRELGVQVRYETGIAHYQQLDGELVVAADGINSGLRTRYREQFGPEIDLRPNRFVWLGTSCPFPAFAFYFKNDRHGLWRAHAYQYAEGASTFIVETTDSAFASAGLDEADEAATLAFCQQLFADELQGHGLIANRSHWRNFPTVRNTRWSHERFVLLGDAAHTAHFSIGSGTKLALEDAIALRDALAQSADVSAALATYEEARRPTVESLQRAAQASLQWFEETERYLELEPIQFGFSLLTRSLRITHEELRQRDASYVHSIDHWFEQQALAQAKLKAPPVGHRPKPPLFTPFRLRDLTLPNRIVLSAMCQYSAKAGGVDDWHLVHLGSRAIGGAGLLITEMTDISPEGRITPGCAGIYQQEHVAAWRRIVDFVHAHSAAKIGMQLAHAGRKGATKRSWEGIDQPLDDGGWPLIAPSPLPYLPQSQTPREMTRDDMDKVRDDFTAAARLADLAGFDLLELHFAHGYLLASFISPLTNTRCDEYGGSLEQRMRFPLEVLDAVRRVWPAHKPISVRISAVDWYPGGMQPEDAVQVARMLKAHECDITDVSAGQTVPDQRPRYGRLFQTPFSDRIRHEVCMATMAVGNISSYTDVNTILAAGRADLCAIARAQLWDPYWTRHAAHELDYDLPWPPPYAVLQHYRPRFK